MLPLNNAKPVDKPSRCSRIMSYICFSILFAMLVALMFWFNHVLKYRSVRDSLSSNSNETSTNETTAAVKACFKNREDLAKVLDAYMDQIANSSAHEDQWNSSWCTEDSDVSEAFVNRTSSDLPVEPGEFRTTGTSNMSHAFDGYDQEDDEVLDLTGWDTSAVTDMTGLFRRARVRYVNCTGWDTSKVVSMKDLLRESWIERVFGMEEWDTSSVANMSGLAREANSWKVGNLKGWNTSRVTDMNNGFREAWNFTGDGIDQWDVSSVVDLSGAFRDAFQFNASLSQWDVQSCRDLSWTFSGAYLYNDDLSAWNVSNVEDLSYTFFRAFTFDGLIHSWDTSNVTNMAGTFRSSGFNGDIANWNVTNTWNFVETFRNSNFTGDLGNWQPERATTMRYMFADNQVYNGDLTRWNVSNVLDMAGMFENAEAFEGAGLPFWDIQQVNNMTSMFSNAIHFRQDLCAWPLATTDAETSTSIAVQTADMFCGSGCPTVKDPRVVGGVLYNACYKCRKSGSK